MIRLIRETVSLPLGVTLVVGLAACAAWAFYKALVVRKTVQAILGATQELLGEDSRDDS